MRRGEEEKRRRGETKNFTYLLVYLRPEEDRKRWERNDK
jgi:hypothetical protein